MKYSILPSRQKFLKALTSSLVSSEVPTSKIPSIILQMKLLTSKLTVSLVPGVGVRALMSGCTSIIERYAQKSPNHMSGYVIGDILHNYVNLLYWYKSNVMMNQPTDNRYALAFADSIDIICKMLEDGANDNWSNDIANNIHSRMVDTNLSSTPFVS